MKISYSTDLANLNTMNGYGNAGFNIVTSLQANGYEVQFQDRTAPVNINFVQPEYYEFISPYNIGYTPWESTKVPELWKYPIKECDEFWTTSEWCRQVFEDNGIKVDKVLHHGVGDEWIAHKRKPRDKIRFLHVGEPAPRKNGQQVLNVFYKLFGSREDVSLTIKAHHHSTLRIYDRMGSIVAAPEMLNNVNVIREQISNDAMVSLYWSHDALVYPSAGEGFGLIPLQALATGMPTICTGAWAPYANYLGPLALDSRLVDSPWDFGHPGQVYEISDDELADKMLYTVNNYDQLSTNFMTQAPLVQKDYNWRKVVREAFAPLKKSFESGRPDDSSVLG